MIKINSETSKRINDYLINQPPAQDEIGYYNRIANKFGVSAEGIRKKCRKLGLAHIRINSQVRQEYDNTSLITLLKNGTYTVEELSNKTGVLPKDIRKKIAELKLEKYNVVHKEHKYELSDQVAVGSAKRLDIKNWQGDVLRFGFVSDTHLGSKFERMDVLNALYDIYADEGIDTIYHGGNIVDGECRFNKYEIHTQGLTPQVEYCINNYPKRKGVTTYFITGDDHEGWWIQRERINIGEHIQMKAQSIGRDDLQYIGHVEADIDLAENEGKSWMRIMHGGGGTAYALSYTPQKIVECVPLNSEMLTKSGWKGYSEVDIGEEVLGFNKDTAECGWGTLLDINKYDSQEVVTYKNDNFIVKCTRNHKWVMLEESRAGANSNCINPTPYNKREIVLKTIDEVINDWKRYRIIQSAPSPSGDNYKYYSLEESVDRVNCIENVLKMSSDQRKSFIYGMMIGEGTLANKKTPVFSQRPNEVLESFRLACFLEGISTGMSRKTTKKINGEDKVCCRTSLLKKPLRMVSSMREVDTEITDVWCPTTTLGNWIMRQGNVITITGNSYQGGEKPRILLLGHYHKIDYCFPREVHVIQMGCTEDQTIFMRKKKIQAHIGGGILKVNRAPDGSINRVNVEYITFFDKGFYVGKDKYWK